MAKARALAARHEKVYLPLSKAGASINSLYFVFDSDFAGLFVLPDFQVLNDIRALLTTSGAPLRLYRARPSTSHQLSNRASEMVEFDELLSTLEMWADQLASLKVRAD